MSKLLQFVFVVEDMILDDNPAMLVAHNADNPHLALGRFQLIHISVHVVDASLIGVHVVLDPLIGVHGSKAAIRMTPATDAF